VKKETDLAVKDPGDSSVVLRAYVRWRDKPEEVTKELADPAVANVSRHPDGSWMLAFSIPRAGKRVIYFAALSVDGVMRADRWPIMKLAPGVWDLPASIFIPGQVHVFLTVLGIPDPAPWEE